MGHVRDRFIVDNREEIMFVANDFAFYNTNRMENPDGDYHGNMTIHDNKIYADYDSAMKAIDEFDTGFYSDHAVRFDNEGDTKWLVKVEVHC